jgi:hypothetical protein
MIHQFASAVLAGLIVGRIAQTLNPRTTGCPRALRPRRNG